MSPACCKGFAIGGARDAAAPVGQEELAQPWQPQAGLLPKGENPAAEARRDVARRVVGQARAAEKRALRSLRASWWRFLHLQKVLREIPSRRQARVTFSNRLASSHQR